MNVAVELLETMSRGARHYGDIETAEETLSAAKFVLRMENALAVARLVVDGDLDHAALREALEQVHEEGF